MAADLDDLAGLEIVVTQNDDTTLVIASEPTYAQNGEGALVLNFDGIAALALAELQAAQP